MRKQLASLCSHTPPDAVRSGSVIWIGAQFDRRPDSEERSASEQAAQCLRQIWELLHALGEPPAALVKLLCFYRMQASAPEQEQQLRRSIAAQLPDGCRIALTMLPLPRLAQDTAKVMMEGCAMPAALPRQYSETPAGKPFVRAVRCGKLIFLSAQQAHAEGIVPQTHQIMQQLRETLAVFGAGFADVVKLNRWYLGSGTVEDFEPAALACASYFSEPGPAATGIPLPALAYPGQAIQIELIAMQGEDGKSLPRRHVRPDSLWDWTVPLPYWHGLKCHDMVFLGGQVALDQQGRAVAPGQMVAQTQLAMQHIQTILAQLNVPWADVCKLTSHHQDGGLPAMQAAREAAATLDGITFSDIPFPTLAYPQMVVEIDCFAVTEPDCPAKGGDSEPENYSSST